MPFLFLRIWLRKLLWFDGFTCVCYLFFLSYSLLYCFSIFLCLFFLLIICRMLVLFWSSLFGVLDASCTWMGIVFSRFGKLFVIILLNILWIPFACISSSYSMPMILRFGLLMELVSFCIFLSQILNCLTNSYLGFPLISILYSSSEILSFACSSLLDWPYIVFCVSVSFFFLRFSISWVTSSLILTIFIFNSFISLFIVFSVSLWCLGLLWVHLFVSVSSHILYFLCLEISWMPLVCFG
jgi:hypothetical protein